jgi:quercetin dioxygenase-like cupin family protein
MPIKYSMQKWSEPYSPNPAMLRQILTIEGYQVFSWTDQPGIIYGMHKHDEQQSHWVISGKLEITVEHVGTFLLEAGDRDFMPANCYHSARVIGDEPVTYLIGSKEITEITTKEIKSTKVRTKKVRTKKIKVKEKPLQEPEPLSRDEE